MFPFPNILTRKDPADSALSFAICADVHKDIMHDADERLASFIEAAKAKELDFILQLGDFCIPTDKNRSFVDIWNSYPGDRYHVLGNHDMDNGYSKEETIAFWKAKGKYYSFDKKRSSFCDFRR